MNELTHPQIKSLLLVDTPPCVSIYVPLSMAEFSDQWVLSGCYEGLRETSRALLAKSYSERVTSKMLARLNGFQLPERLRNGNTQGTLAIFSSPTLEGFVHIPEEVPAMAVVANSFHIKPLLEMLVPSRNFYVLDLQSRRATLYKGNREGLEVVQSFLANEPEQLLLEEEGEGGFIRRHLDAMRLHLSSEFLGRVEAQVTAQMTFSLSSALFVVGKRHCTNQYMRINRYAGLHSTPIWAAEGRVRNEKFLKTVHQSALKQSDKILKREKNKSIVALRKARSRGLLEQDLNAIVRALSLGRVRTLYIKKNELMWGTVDWKSGRLSLNSTQSSAFDDDVIDDCVEKALGNHDTKIVCLEEGDLAPGESLKPIAAILMPEAPRIAVMAGLGQENLHSPN